ncbi:conserved hypothetical protein [Rippkaea orientalis PCC 8801]|uniref:DUF6916 domain-containing protein n=1 Tax=Rippkaea orientalis (strain PCC 8801 / RF-1) TaxID=41431 RepID=B7JYU1_RIPO1|nr:hypothetical protein [Rippkaea orientalis]ACK66018.1 conserved hypothetical protein [Rippkaea orientalis PCC 8801]
MITNLEKSLFDNYLEDEFYIKMSESESIQFKLVEVESLQTNQRRKPSNKIRSQPFSLIFVGPLTPIFNQSIYQLSHPQLGEIEIFLVPLGESDTGIEYQAIFT